MITIGITLDDVLRNKTEQFGKIFKKYVDKNINLDALDLSTGNLSKIFGFKTNMEYIKFLYEDYSFEIFGEANVPEKMLDKEFNLWHLSLNNNEHIDDELNIVLMNPREFNTSIGYTYFFLSKLATRVREIYLPEDYMSIWDKCDILITADKKLLSKKPANKISVKINTPYNSDDVSDFNFDSLMSLIKSKTFLVDAVEKFNENKDK